MQVLCAHVCDIDLDGEPELLLGTHGHRLLVYKLQEGDSNPPLLIAQKLFKYPVHVRRALISILCRLFARP